MPRFRLRTVLDVRPEVSRRYRTQILLLVASWRAHVTPEGDIPLEVVILGDPAAPLTEILASFGAQLLFAEPCAAGRLAPTANKIAGLLVPADGDGVWLVDNDTCFVGPVGLPDNFRDAEVAVAPAGRFRVSDKQWQIIEAELGLRPPDYAWTPLNEAYCAQVARRSAMKSRRFYANAGSVLVRSPTDFGRRWEAYVERIALHFRNHPLGNKHVCRSDMAGLAVALGEVRNFALLPDGWNYRPPSLWACREVAPEVRLLHLTDIREPKGYGGRPISRMVEDFWRDRMLISLSGAKISSSASAFAKVLLGRVHAIIDQFCLDRLGTKVRTE